MNWYVSQWCGFAYWDLPGCVIIPAGAFADRSETLMVGCGVSVIVPVMFTREEARWMAPWNRMLIWLYQ